MGKLKVFEMFAGYGGASFALKKANINHEIVGFSEINKHSIKCYEQNHTNIKNYGDISNINIDELPDFDLLTGGFPCQDVSVAGNRDLSKGRTLLINYVFKILKKKTPKYVLLENVKGLLSTEPLWTNIKWTLNKLGYDIRYKVLNSKEHGIPQSRERIWILCSKKNFEPFKQLFPEKVKLTIELKDLLELNVDEKYYLTDEQINTIKNRNRFGDQLLQGHEKWSPCLLAIGQCDVGIINEPKFLLNNYKDKWRRLTPTECFRLMGFLDDEINIENISNSQLYRLAGNGWEINVVSKIFKLWFLNTKYVENIK